MIILGLVLVAFLYLFFPIIYVNRKGKVKFLKALFLSAINSTICTSFIIICVMLGAEDKNNINYVSVGIFWFFVSLLIVLPILSKKRKKKDTTTETNLTEDTASNENVDNTEKYNDNK